MNSRSADTNLKRTVFEAGSDEVDRLAWTRVNDAQRQVAVISSVVAAWTEKEKIRNFVSGIHA